LVTGGGAVLSLTGALSEPGGVLVFLLKPARLIESPLVAAASLLWIVYKWPGGKRAPRGTRDERAKAIAVFFRGLHFSVVPAVSNLSSALLNMLGGLFLLVPSVVLNIDAWQSPSG
jgi:hypothetical protein